MILSVGYRRLVISLVLPVVVACLASGCLWGVVTDAETGGPVPDASVVWWDDDGNGGSATADANGLYRFDAVDGGLGDVFFFVSSENGGGLLDRRPLEGVQLFAIPTDEGEFHDAIRGYSIAFPEDWLVSPEMMTWEDDGFGVSAMPPDEEEICEVASGPASDMDFELPDESESDLPLETTILERDEVEIAGETGERFIIEITPEIEPEEEMEIDGVKALVYLFQRGDEGWAIACATMSSEFEARLDMYEEVAESFEFDQ